MEFSLVIEEVEKLLEALRQEYLQCVRVCVCIINPPDIPFSSYQTLDDRGIEYLEALEIERIIKEY